MRLLAQKIALKHKSLIESYRVLLNPLSLPLKRGELPPFVKEGWGGFQNEDT